MEKPALELFTNVTFVKRDDGGGCLGVLEDRLGRGSARGGFSLVSCFFHPASTVCTNTPDDILRYNRNRRIYNWH